MNTTRAACLVLALSAASACGGRSNLEAGESGFADPGAAEPGSPDDAAPGSAHAGAAPGAGSGSAAGGAAGGTTASSGASSHGGDEPSSQAGASMTLPEPDPGPAPDPGNPNCTAANAKGGNACTAPCVTTCGYYDMGTKACDCASGVFVSCHCPRPWNYQGRTTAPPCDTLDGRTHWIDNTACGEEWAQCIGTDPVSGTNPRGCVCLTDPVNGQLEWTCGSTNKWFLSE